MLNIKNIDQQELKNLCDLRGVNIDVPEVIKVRDSRDELRKVVEDLRARANAVAAAMKSSSDGERQELRNP